MGRKKSKKTRKSGEVKLEEGKMLIRGIKKVVKEKHPEVLKRRKIELAPYDDANEFDLMGLLISDAWIERVTTRSIRIGFGSPRYVGLSWAYKLMRRFRNRITIRLATPNEESYNRSSIIVQLQCSIRRRKIPITSRIVDEVVGKVRPGEVRYVSREEAALIRRKIVNYVCELALRGDDEPLMRLLSTFLDGDGDITKFFDKRYDQYRIMIRITQKDKEILEKIREALISLGHSTSIVKSRDKWILKSYDAELLMRLNPRLSYKKERLEIVKQFRKTTFRKEEFEKYAKWTEVPKEYADQWITRYYAETPAEKKKLLNNSDQL